MKKIFLYTIASALFLIGAAFTIQQIINWKIDSENAQVKFTMKAHGQELIGNFKGVKGEINFNTNDLASSSFKCSIDVATINTGIAERDGHLQGPKWFDAANSPTINFVSSKIEPSSENKLQYIATGTLSIKGTTRDVRIPFEFKKEPLLGDGIRNSFVGDFTIKRTEFNVGKADGDVSDDVMLHVEIPVTKAE